ncbi:hypothetical protein CPC08DRAFT_592372, partial [Agrocybe pediades]
PQRAVEYNGEVFIPDEGANKIWRLVKDGAPGTYKITGQIDVLAGPRRIAIRDSILFTIHSTGTLLTAHQIPASSNGTALPPIASVSILPPEFRGENVSGYEIVISETNDQFPVPLIYVSTGTLGPQNFDERGDIIAVYEFKTGTAVAGDTTSTSTATATASEIEKRDDVSWIKGEFILHSRTFTGLRQIRGMAIGKQADGVLVAGGAGGGGVVVYHRTDQGRNLTLGARKELPMFLYRTSFTF